MIRPNALTLTVIGILAWSMSAMAQEAGDLPAIFSSNLGATLAHADSVPLSQTMSQIADGTGWKSTIVLANTDTVDAPFTLRFWMGDGSALSLPFGTAGNLHEVTGTIPKNGSQILETDGTALTLSQGWGELITSNSIGGTTIFRQHVAGQADSEASTPVTGAVTKQLLLPYDNTQGFVTAAALVNADSSNATSIHAICYDQTGANIGTSDIALPAHGQIAFALSSNVPASAGKRGVVAFSSSGTVITGLGLRFSPNGTFTSIEMLPGK